MEPLSKDDLPNIESAAIFYAGWLGHYVGDGCMPLHASINVSGWIEKANPNHYTTAGTIHHNYEAVTDQAIADHAITVRAIESLVPPVRSIPDSFAGTLTYLRAEGSFAPQVYEIEKHGALTNAGTPALDTFTEARMAEGAAMLRDLIYSAWLQSKDAKAPDLPASVVLEAR
jgi:hypothetical protein